MGIWLNAWAGDHAGSVLGRQPYRALVAYTYSDPDYSNAFYDAWEDTDGTIIYPEIEARCLTTPNAMDAIVTKTEPLGAGVSSLEVTPVKSKGKDPWNTGVHLFGIAISSPVSNSSSGTIATVVVPSKVTIAKELSDNANAVVTMLKLSRRRQALANYFSTWRQNVQIPA
jgi:hypothetical protein